MQRHLAGDKDVEGAKRSIALPPPQAGEVTAEFAVTVVSANPHKQNGPPDVRTGR